MGIIGGMAKSGVAPPENLLVAILTLIQRGSVGPLDQNGVLALPADSTTNRQPCASSDAYELPPDKLRKWRAHAVKVLLAVLTRGMSGNVFLSESHQFGDIYRINL